jgi:hypothetical protein
MLEPFRKVHFLCLPKQKSQCLEIKLVAIFSLMRDWGYRNFLEWTQQWTSGIYLCLWYINYHTAGIS